MVEDMIATREEEPPGGNWSGPLLVPVMKEGRRVGTLPSLDSARAACQEHLEALPPELKRLRSPAAYPVRQSAALELRQREATAASH
jgi:nicotinate phosphoribosyltransferase